MSNEKITPIRKQYLEIKSQYPDALLFFRLGDFYETFDQDAEIAARELDIVLTSRNVAKGNRVPMAGIPHHAAENYISRLIERGYHVAICEQIGEQPLKGIFPRKVTRVVTPGTIVEPGLLAGDENNYLACVVMDENKLFGSAVTGKAKRAAVGYVDITTGEFAVTELGGSDVINLLRTEIVRLNPAELLYPESRSPGDGFSGHLTPWPDWRFEPGRCEGELTRHFDVASLEGFGLRGKMMAVSAAGAILQYLNETQPAAADLLQSISTYSTSEFMNLDAATRRNLELTSTIRGAKKGGFLLDILDHTVSPMGKRLIHAWFSKPLLDIKRINDRQDGVMVFVEDGLLRNEVVTAIKSLGDLERLANRVAGGSAIPRDITSIRATLVNLPELIALLPDGDPRWRMLFLSWIHAKRNWR